MTYQSKATDMNDLTTQAPGDKERSAMDDPTTKVRRRRAGRRMVTAGVVVAAGALLASAAAWACTLRDGVTLKVFNDDLYNSCAGAGPTGEYCSKAVGNGAQTGLATVDNLGNDVLSIAGSGFKATSDPDTAYSITWRHTSSTGNCHRTNIDGSIVMMGASATVTSGGTLDVTRTAVNTQGRNPETGLLRICVQDYEFGGTSTASATPTVVVGQIVDISVV